MARSFGAAVDLPAPGGSGLFLISGNGVSPDGAVVGVGGQVVVRFPGTVKLLAVMPVTAESAARRHPDIALVGPVVIDPNRFAAFAALAGLDDEPVAD